MADELFSSYVWVVEASPGLRYNEEVGFYRNWVPMLMSHHPNPEWPDGVHYTRENARKAARKMLELNIYVKDKKDKSGPKYRVKRYWRFD
jgi:hypothetical protein